MKKEDCVIIPIKEYEALKNEIKELKKENIPDISIEWGYSHNRYEYCYSNRGKLTLSEGLYNQIRRICALINKEMNDKMLDKEKRFYQTREIITENVKGDVLYEVQHLPWYKRLWFKPEYIK